MVCAISKLVMTQSSLNKELTIRLWGSQPVVILPASHLNMVQEWRKSYITCTRSNTYRVGFAARVEWHAVDRKTGSLPSLLIKYSHLLTTTNFDSKNL